MNKVRFQQILRRAFWFAFGIALILAATLILEVQFLMKRAAWVEHTDQVITLSQRIYRIRIDQETGLRAYLLTNDERFLQSFLQAQKQALALEPALRQLVSDNPEQTARNETSFQAFHAWSSWAEQAIVMARAGEDAGDVQLQLRGKELMDQFRAARTEFLEREQQLRDERLASSRRSLDFVNGSVVALCILFGVGFAALGRRQLKSLSQSFNEALNTAEANAVEARAQKERLGGIIGSAMDAIITVDESQRIQVFNRAAEEVFRCAAADALGAPLDRFIPERFRQLHRSHVEGFGQAGVTARSMYRPGTLFGLRYDGEEFPIEATISQIEKAGQRLFTVILRDITERKQAEDAARAHAIETQAQKDWLHTTLSSIGDAVIATDAEGAITLMNPVAQNLTGWTFEEAKGKPLTEVFRIVNQQTRETVENPVDKVRRLKQVVGLANHTILISKSGQEIAIDDSGAPILGSDGTIAGIVLVFRDVTRQRALEAALQSNERLALAGRLSASIAHEIHNPLDTVGNVLFLLKEQSNDLPETQKLITTALTEVQRVTEISKNMLSLHRESRAASAVRISELLEGVVTLIEETIAKGRRNFYLDHGFEGEIEGFPSELRQVFTNVIKNAVEATPEGGDIRIVSQSGCESGCGGVLVHVADNGVGIPEQMQSKLFSPFASTKDESGTGLGLWVSRSIVEKHGGTIRVSSSISPAGTRVSIFLPLQASARKKTADAALAAHGDGG